MSRHEWYCKIEDYIKLAANWPGVPADFNPPTSSCRSCPVPRHWWNPGSTHWLCWGQPLSAVAQLWDQPPNQRMLQQQPRQSQRCWHTHPQWTWCFHWRTKKIRTLDTDPTTICNFHRTMVGMFWLTRVKWIDPKHFEFASITQLDTATTNIAMSATSVGVAKFWLHFPWSIWSGTGLGSHTDNQPQTL